MRYMFQEFGGVVINGIIATFIFALFFTQLYPVASNNAKEVIEGIMVPKSVTLNDELYAPSLFVSSCVIQLNTTFDYHNYTSAYSHTGKDLSNNIQIVKGEVNVNTPGKYEVTFKVTDQGVSTYKVGVFLVEGLT